MKKHLSHPSLISSPRSFVNRVRSLSQLVVSNTPITPLTSTRLRSIPSPDYTIEISNSLSIALIDRLKEIKDSNGVALLDINFNNKPYTEKLIHTLTPDQILLLIVLDDDQLINIAKTICKIKDGKTCLSPIEVRRVFDAYEKLSFSTKTQLACEKIEEHFIKNPKEYKQTLIDLIDTFITKNTKRMEKLHLTYHRWTHGMDMYLGAINDNIHTEITDPKELSARLGALILVPFMALNHDGYQQLNTIINTPDSPYATKGKHSSKVFNWLATHKDNPIKCLGANEEITAEETYQNYIKPLADSILKPETTSHENDFEDIYDGLTSLTTFTTVHGTRLTGGFLSQELIGAANLLAILRTKKDTHFDTIKELSPHREFVHPSLLKPALTLTLRDITRTARTSTNEEQQNLYTLFYNAYPETLKATLTLLFKTPPPGSFEQFLENSSRMFPELKIDTEDDRQSWYSLQQELSSLFQTLLESDITEKSESIIKTITAKLATPLMSGYDTEKNKTYQEAYKTILAWTKADIGFSLTRDPNDASTTFKTIINNPDSTEWGETIPTDQYHRELNETNNHLVTIIDTSDADNKQTLELALAIHIFRHFSFSNYSNPAWNPDNTSTNLALSVSERCGNYHFDKLMEFSMTHLPAKKTHISAPHHVEKPSSENSLLPTIKG